MIIYEGCISGESEGETDVISVSDIIEAVENNPSLLRTQLDICALIMKGCYIEAASELAKLVIKRRDKKQFHIYKYDIDSITRIESYDERKEKV